jgi:hypothetical protein
MRLALLSLAIYSVGATACSSPLSPDTQLAGAWETAPIPSGGGTVATLLVDGHTVLGSGYRRDIGPNPAHTPLTVRGSQAGRAFVLEFTFDDGVEARYSGQVVSATELAGTWSVPGVAARSLTFYRQQH